MTDVSVGKSVPEKECVKSEGGPVNRITFYPFAYALFTDELVGYCWYCLKPDVNKRHCKGCGFALFCDKECLTLGWKDHMAECKGLRKVQVVPDIETRLLGRIVTRYKAIYSGKDKEDPNFYKDRTSKRGILDIWSHTEKIKNDPIAMKKFEEIYKNLHDFYGPKAMMSKEIIFQLHCRDFINRHAICDSGYLREIGKGLYLDLCQYDHSCRPNSIYTCDGFIATLRSLQPNVDLSDTKNTRYTYIDLLNPLQQRRKLLRDTWYFTCECDRCVDPKDHLVSAVLCPFCPWTTPATLCIFGDHPYKDPVSLKITCPKCGNETPPDYVAECISLMRGVENIFEENDLSKMTRKDQLEFMNNIFEKYARMLPPTNVFLGKLIQALINRVSSNEDLLRLHLSSEPCVRACFPPNHPAIAFHIRNVGIFLSNLDHYEEAIPYFEEADRSLTSVLDANHPLTTENRRLLNIALSKMQDAKKRERFANMSLEERRKIIEEDIRKFRMADALKVKKDEEKAKAEAALKESDSMKKNGNNNNAKKNGKKVDEQKSNGKKDGNGNVETGEGEGTTQEAYGDKKKPFVEVVVDVDDDELPPLIE